MFVSAQMRRCVEYDKLGFHQKESHISKHDNAVCHNRIFLKIVGLLVAFCQFNLSIHL